MTQQIAHRVFYIKYTKEIYAQLIFGTIPQEIIYNKQYYGNCQAILEDRFDPVQINNGWHCKIIGTKFNKDIVHKITDTRAIFDINKLITIVPMSFLLYLEKYYFNELISKGKCWFGLKKGYYTIACSQNNYLLNPINFILGEWAMVFSIVDLFFYDQFEQEYEFILKGQLANNVFILGDSILRKFQMVFDKDNKQIGFYSKTNVIRTCTILLPIVNIDINDDNNNIKLITQFIQNPINVKETRALIHNTLVVSLCISLLITVLFCLCLIIFRNYRRKAMKSKSYNDSFYQSTNNERIIVQ